MIIEENMDDTENRLVCIFLWVTNHISEKYLYIFRRETKEKLEENITWKFDPSGSIF